MTDRHSQDPTAPTPAGAARQPRQADGNGRRRALGYVAVGAVCLVAGAAALYLALRAGLIPVGLPSPQASHAGPSAAAAPAGGEMAGMPGMGTSPASGGEPEGGASGSGVYISPARQQLIGVRTGTVAYHTLDTTIRTVGILAYDETRVTQMNPKVAGWIERVYVDYVGKPVRRGEPLFTVYSPELVATQNEYLLALKARNQFASSSIAETRANSEALLAATRQRLKLWDVTDDQIAELERTGQPRRTMTVYAPFNGIVLDRNAFAGQYITPEMPAFKLADLSTIWVIGEVFEYELGLIAVGQEADIEFPYGEYGHAIKGRVGFVYPDIDPQTRRVRIRLEFGNASGRFKPGTYVTVSIRNRGAHALAIPKEAVIDTGVKQVALLTRPDGYFEPREIKVGQPTDEFYPVLSGLKEGDRIVTSAQFLVDSEANLQSAMQAMSMSMPGMDMGGEKKPAAVPKAKPPAAPDEMPGMPGMQMPPKKNPEKTPDSMDDMPGMPMPPAKTPVPPPKKSGGSGRPRSPQAPPAAASDGAGGAR